MRNMNKSKKNNNFRKINSIVAILLCLTFIFNAGLSQTYADDSQTIINKDQQGSLFKLHTSDGYWVIEDESIVKKVSEGITVMYSKMYDYIRIEGLKSGSTNVKFYSNSGVLLGKHSVKVITPIDKFTISESNLYMAVNEERNLSVNINPIDADHKDVYWESSNTDIVEVDSNGNIKAKSDGQATITAKSSDNVHSDECVVNVVIPTTSIEVGNEDILITSRLDENQIKTKVYPENATNKNLIFESSDTNVVKVNQYGYLEAINNGTATITIKSEDGFSVATKNITIEGLVEDISLNETSIELNDVGETFKVEATINPQNAIDKSIKWTSSDEKVATVDQGGIITAKSVGQCKIYATSKDGKVSSYLDVKVNPLLKLSFYEILEYTANSYSSTIILSDKYVKKDNTVKLEIPKKHGYKFEGWYRDFNNGNYLNLVENNEISIKYDTTLYAKFTPIKVTGIKLTNEYITSDGVNNTLNINGEFTPGYVANGRYTVTSSNTKVAEVESPGWFTSYGEDNKNIIHSTLKINGNGTTTITVKTEDGNYTASKKITIGKDDISGEQVVINETVPKLSLSMSLNNCVKIDFPYYEGATSYDIYASDSLGNSWSININNPKQGSYIDTSANNPNVTYSYKMKVNYGIGVKTKCGPVSSFKIAQKYSKSLTKDIYKYDAGKGKYLTYINGKGYSQYTYLNTSGNYAFTPSSWMKAAGLNVSMPTKSNGYTMVIENNYIDLYNESKSILEGAKSGELSKSEISKQLNLLKNKKLIEESKSTKNTVESKSSISKTLTKDIYKYDAVKGKYKTYINGK